MVAKIVTERDSNLPFDAKAFVSSLPELPGVYRMISASGDLLYVGKAKSLKKRVASYFRDPSQLSPRIALMVEQIAAVDTTVTRSEAEALLLESNLIKSRQPKYNILFRDDKSYPYLLLTADAYPRVGFHRTARGTAGHTSEGRFFGPYPNAWSVREATHLLQRMFKLRTCEESVFRNRSRPCLLHQIKRCSAPCVGKITQERYADEVRLATLFLEGRQNEVVDRLTQQMEVAAEGLAFEQAAQFRDQIRDLNRMREKQIISGAGSEEADVISAVFADGMLCLNLAIVRGGQHLGDKPLFPANVSQVTENEAIAAFLMQHYAQHPLPSRILLSHEPGDEARETLALLAREKLSVSVPQRGMHRAWLEMAERNAQLAITARILQLTLSGKRPGALAEALGLVEIPERIECFDISHTQGESTVASCVVWASGAMKKSDYRRFNISGITPGDDYAAIRQAVSRRFEKLAAGEGAAPGLLLIDGGKGQVTVAAEVMAELGLFDIPLLGVAKGEARKPGLEELVFADDRPPLKLPADHPGLHLIQEVRDEAHRFAISGHRGQRGKARKRSTLEDIPGIGNERRKRLLAQFGGLRGIMAASTEDIARVQGIGEALADVIYRHLHH